MISQVTIIAVIATLAAANVILPVHHAPQPYKFGYDVKDMHGQQYRQEEGNGGSGVKGSYGFTDARGVKRQVNYVADHGGFRAQVKTNEPGTANQNPAAVLMVSDAPYAGGVALGGLGYGVGNLGLAGTGIGNGLVNGGLSGRGLGYGVNGINGLNGVRGLGYGVNNINNGINGLNGRGIGFGFNSINNGLNGRGLGYGVNGINNGINGLNGRGLGFGVNGINNGLGYGGLGIGNLGGLGYARYAY